MKKIVIFNNFDFFSPCLKGTDPLAQKFLRKRILENLLLFKSSPFELTLDHYINTQLWNKFESFKNFF